MWLENVVASAELEHLDFGHGLGDGQALVLVVNVTELVVVIASVQELKVLVEVGIDTHLGAYVAVHAIVDLWLSALRWKSQGFAHGAGQPCVACSCIS